MLAFFMCVIRNIFLTNIQQHGPAAYVCVGRSNMQQFAQLR